MELQTYRQLLHISVSTHGYHGPKFMHWVIHKFNSRWLLLLMRFQQLPTSLLPLVFASFLTKLVQDIKSYYASRFVFVGRLTIFRSYRSDTVINKLIVFVVNTGMWFASFRCYSFTHAFYLLLLAAWQRMHYYLYVVARGIASFQHYLFLLLRCCAVASLISVSN